MDVSTLYAIRDTPRSPLPQAIADVISKLKISFKPAFRRPPVATARRRPEGAANWRENVLVEMVRKVREKDDPDYDEVSAAVNKLSKQNYEKMSAEIFACLDKRDPLFRFRVTTLLFDRGIRQPFFAPIMSDIYRDVVAHCEDARSDLATQVMMFDALYDVGNVTMVPSANDKGYDEAIIAWTKQKELKRGFAVYVSELYVRGLVPEETMTKFVSTVVDDLKESIRAPKTPPREEHADALVRFLFATASKVSAVKPAIRDILALPRGDVPCLNMKSRFKLEDALK
jgi:hypothetical protein